MLDEPKKTPPQLATDAQQYAFVTVIRDSYAEAQNLTKSTTTDTPITTVEEALAAYTKPHYHHPAEDTDEFRTLFRAVVRRYCLEQAVIHADFGTEFTLEFDGYGDSGEVHDDPNYPQVVNRFLESMVNQHVTFDWYNNDGGGGDVTWQTDLDVVTINGYYNETVRTDQMTEEEF